MRLQSAAVERTVLASTALRCLDLTLLDGGATEEEVVSMCSKANEHRPAAICVLPIHVEFVRENLDAGIEVACAAGCFPDPNPPLPAREVEVMKAVTEGATEIDVVLDFEAVQEGDYASARMTLDSLINAAAPLPVKVILEVSELDEGQLRDACRLAMSAGCSFLKTSTGRRGPCTSEAAGIIAEEAAKWQRERGYPTGLKLSGGIRDMEDLERMFDAVSTADPEFRFESDRFRIGASTLLDELVRHG